LRNIIEAPGGDRRNSSSGAPAYTALGMVVEQPPASAPASAGKRTRKTLELTTAAPGTTWTYVVKKGDTLERIARRHLGDYRRWTQIQVLNGNIDPRRVRVGQKLIMPARHVGRGTPITVKDPATTRASEAAYKRNRKTPAPAQGGEYYVVRKGDVLGTISLKTLGTSKRWREILALNPKVDPRRLTVGMKLLLPKRAVGTPLPAGPKLAQGGDVRPIPASAAKKKSRPFVR